MFNFLRRFLPSPLLKTLRKVKIEIVLISNYFHDFCMYHRHSATINPYKTKSMYQAHIIKNYHSLEKGLSVKNPRPGFGRAVVMELIEELNEYASCYGTDELFQVALNVLSAYYEYNTKNHLTDEELNSQLAFLRKRLGETKSRILGGGILPITRKNIREAGNIDFQKFVMLRYSIRNFAPSEVEIGLIEKAVRIAQKTPSVCNRQPWIVHVFRDEDKNNKLLDIQGGSRGFGNDASIVLIITCDLGAFMGVGERNEAYIDGGMFAMSLVYAIHSLGLGTCCLNLAVECEVENKIRILANIPKNEKLILMIAVGNIPEFLYVAQSHRKALEEVMVFHSTSS